MATLGCHSADYNTGGNSGGSASNQATTTTSGSPDEEHRWSGTDGKTTNMFTMDDDRSWSVQATARSADPDAAVMAVAVKRPDGDLVQQTEMGLGTNRTFIHAQGEFYLQIITANLSGWEVVASP